MTSAQPFDEGMDVEYSVPRSPSAELLTVSVLERSQIDSGTQVKPVIGANNRPANKGRAGKQATQHNNPTMTPSERPDATKGVGLVDIGVLGVLDVTPTPGGAGGVKNYFFTAPSRTVPGGPDSVPVKSQTSPVHGSRDNPGLVGANPVRPDSTPGSKLATLVSSVASDESKAAADDGLTGSVGLARHHESTVAPSMRNDAMEVAETVDHGVLLVRGDDSTTGGGGGAKKIFFGAPPRNDQGGPNKVPLKSQCSAAITLAANRETVPTNHERRAGTLASVPAGVPAGDRVSVPAEAFAGSVVSVPAGVSAGALASVPAVISAGALVSVPAEVSAGMLVPAPAGSSAGALDSVPAGVSPLSGTASPALKSLDFNAGSTACTNVGGAASAEGMDVSWCDMVEAAIQQSLDSKALSEDFVKASTSANTVMEPLGDMEVCPVVEQTGVASRKRTRGGRARRGVPSQASLSPTTDEEESGRASEKKRLLKAPISPPSQIKLSAPSELPVPGAPLEALRDKAMSLEREMAIFCLDDTKKINKSQMAVITGKFREMQGIVGDLLIRNARLEGRLQELQKKKEAGEPAYKGMAGAPVFGSTQSTAEKKMPEKPKLPQDRAGASSYAAVTKQTAAPKAAPRQTAAAPPKMVSSAQLPGGEPSVRKAPGGADSEEFTLVGKRGRRGRGRGAGTAGAGVGANGDRGSAKTDPPAQKAPAPARAVPRRPPLPAVVLRPIAAGQGAGTADSEKTKKAIMETLNPVREGIHVCGVKKMKNGAVLVETTSQADVLKILNNPALNGRGLQASLPAPLHPEIIIYNVSGGSSEAEVTEAIHSLNGDLFEGLSLAEFGDKFKLRYRAGPRRSDSVHWVASVPPSLHEAICRRGHLFVGWRRCAVRSITRITRCYKCQAYGHVAKHCREAQDTCGHCAAKGHRITACPKRAAGVSPVCAPCRRQGKRGEHDVLSRSCPSYQAALGRHLGRLEVSTTTAQNAQTK